MLHFPLISVVLIGNGSLPNLYQSLNALTNLEYPQDQLEYILILPNHFPLASTMQSLPRFRIIQFDESVSWNNHSARLEGLSFAHGDYVQFIEGHLSLHPQWLKTGLSFFTYQQVAGVIGTIFDEEQNSIVAELNLAEREARPSPILLIDGFYNKAILQQICSGYTIQTPDQSDSSLAVHKVVQTNETMAVVNGDRPVVFKTNHSAFGNRLRELFSRYIFAH